MRKPLMLLAAVVGMTAALGEARQARAEFGAADVVPAASLLLPYFEVDLNSTTGVTTLFSINNASATAALAHVTLWTDQAIPTLNFDVYLTGYDVQTINLRDIFSGNLPVTASAAQDPADTISPHGSLSQDVPMPGAAGLLGPCDNGTVFTNPVLDAAAIADLRAAHTGQNSAVLGGCGAFNFGDDIARGYITVDQAVQCSNGDPSDAGYFGGGGVAGDFNVLWGDYFFVDSGQNFAQGDTLVHIESCSASGFEGVGTGAGACPLAAGDQSFYGRYVAATAVDQREPLSTTFMARYVNGGTFTGGTDFVVWRDTKTPPTGINGPYSCGTGNPGWFPLAHSDVVAFDEQENPTNLCFLSDNVGPPIGGEQPCFPLAAQRIDSGGASVLAPFLVPPAAFGMMYLNLNMSVPGDLFPGVAQAWVSTVMDASGRFSVGFPAVQLDNALYTQPGGVLLIP